MRVWYLFFIPLIALSAGNILAAQRTDPQPVTHQTSSRQTPEEKPCYAGSEGLSCDAIVARAATDQAEDADKQARFLRPQMWLGVATLVSAIAAAIGAGIAAFHTKRSADAANISASLATEGNRITIANQRPWLSVELISIGPAYRNSRNEFSIDYEMSVRNSGLSPATVVVEHFGPTLADPERKLAFSEFVRNAQKEAQFRAQTIAPDATLLIRRERKPIDMHALDENGFTDRGEIPQLWIGVAYQDGIEKINYYTIIILNCLRNHLRNGTNKETFFLETENMKSFMGVWKD